MRQEPIHIHDHGLPVAPKRAPLPKNEASLTSSPGQVFFTLGGLRAFCVHGVSVKQQSCHDGSHKTNE